MRVCLVTRYTTVSGGSAPAFRGLGTILHDLEHDDSAGCIENAHVLNMDAPIVERRVSTESRGRVAASLSQFACDSGMAWLAEGREVKNPHSHRMGGDVG